MAKGPLRRALGHAGHTAHLMTTTGYRLWQTWQQMHYPTRGLPDKEGARRELLAIDGIAGSILEQQFCARKREGGLTAELRESLEQCQLDLERLAPDLSGGARRYFARVRLLVGIALRGDEQEDLQPPASRERLPAHEPALAATAVSQNPSRMARNTPSILVVDDEQNIVDLVSGYLRREGWQVQAATTGTAALRTIAADSPDVVILDLMLPELDGIEVCRRMRSFSDAYVIMLTARAEEVDRIVGLSVGADDYLTKPFSPRELVARVKALLRRPRVGSERSSMGGRGLSVQLGRRRVVADGRDVALTNTEFELLAALVRDPSTVVTRQQLLDRVWGADYFGDGHVIDVHIGNLRRKLADDPDQPRWIETVRGVGFRFVGADA